MIIRHRIGVDFARLAELERFHPEWNRSSSNSASNFIGTESLRDSNFIGMELLRDSSRADIALAGTFARHMQAA